MPSERCKQKLKKCRKIFVVRDSAEEKRVDRYRINKLRDDIVEFLLVFEIGLEGPADVLQRCLHSTGIVTALKAESIMRNINVGGIGQGTGEMESNPSKQVFRTLEITENPWILGYAIVWPIVLGGMPLIYTIILGLFVKDLIGSLSMTMVTEITYRFLIFVAVMGVVVPGNFFGLIRLCTRMTETLSNKLFKALLEADIEYSDKHQTGEIISKLSEDIILIQIVYGIKLVQAISWSAQIATGVGVAFYFSWVAGFIVLGNVIICAIILLFGQKWIDRINKKKMKQAKNSLGKAQEVIEAFRIVKSFDCEMYEKDEYAKQLKIVERTNHSTARAKGIILFIVSIVYWSAICGTVYLTGAQFILGVIEISSFSIVVSALLFSCMGTALLATTFDDFYRGSKACARVWYVIDQKNKIDINNGETYKPIEGRIEFKNVKFSYPTRKDEQVLRGLNIKIEPGQTVALVGESGCGKSSTLALLQRFYNPDSGQILLDGHDLKTLSPTFIHQNIAIVSQNPVLFTMSLADNIKYGKTDATDEEIRKAAEMANCASFIERFPDKYETIYNQNSLSGGEKQRVCVARAVIQNSPVLLLDEATAALDTESEKLVQMALDKAKKGRTTIIVAHRLSTIRDADVIFVIKKGVVVEKGKHEELLALNGEYAELVKLQLS